MCIYSAKAAGKQCILLSFKVSNSYRKNKIHIRRKANSREDMEMVEETLTKKQKQMLAMEDYLDLVDGHKNFEDLTVRQLNQVL